MADWRDWLYETDPVFGYPALKGELTIPDGKGGTIDVSGGRSDKPVEVGRERTGRKTKLGSALLDLMPRMLEAGIAGGATPNVAGGGPVDFMRAAQAGRGALDRRDANQLAMQQHYQQMAQQDALRQSQEAENRAQVDLYRAQTQKALTPAPGFTEKYEQIYRYLVQQGTPEPQAAEQARIAASGGSLQHMKPADPHAGKVRVDPSHPSAKGVTPDADGSVWIPSSWQAPAPQRTPAAPQPHYVPDGKGNVNAVTPSADSPSGFKVTKLEGIGPTAKASAAAKPPKPRSQAPFLKLQQEKIRAFAKAKDVLTKGVALAKGAMGSKDWDTDDPNLPETVRSNRQVAKATALAKIAELKEQYEETMKDVQQNYLDSIDILNATESDKADAEAVKAAEAAGEETPPPPKPMIPNWQRHGFK